MPELLEGLPVSYRDIMFPYGIGFREQAGGKKIKNSYMKYSRSGPMAIIVKVIAMLPLRPGPPPVRKRYSRREMRSEERRVGKEGRSWWSPDHDRGYRRCRYKYELDIVSA